MYIVYILVNRVYFLSVLKNLLQGYVVTLNRHWIDIYSEVGLKKKNRIKLGESNTKLLFITVNKNVWYHKTEIGG